MRAALEQFELLMLGGGPGKVNAGCALGLVPLASLPALSTAKVGRARNRGRRAIRKWLSWVDRARVLAVAKVVVVRAGGTPAVRLRSRPSVRVARGENCGRKSRQGRQLYVYGADAAYVVRFSFSVGALVEFFYADYFVA
jgi:hypothetical protein